MRVSDASRRVGNSEVVPTLRDAAGVYPEVLEGAAPQGEAIRYQPIRLWRRRRDRMPFVATSLRAIVPACLARSPHRRDLAARRFRANWPGRFWAICTGP